MKMLYNYRPIHLIIYGLILMTWLCLPARAQDSFSKRYSASYITMTKGLPHNYIDDIYKDSYGFLWIATGGGGLARYDGYDYIYFGPNYTQRSLKSNFIRYVVEDGFKRLWVVSEGGIDVIDLKTLQSINVNLTTNKHLTALVNVPTSHVIRDTKGCIWFYSNGNKLVHVSFTDEGTIKQVLTLPVTDYIHMGLAIRDIDEDGSVWIHRDGKICKVGLNSNGQLEASPIAPTLDFSSTVTINDMIRNDNEVWITTSSGLYRYDRMNKQIRHYVHLNSDLHSLSHDFVTGMTLTPNKRLIVGSLCGINLYNPLTDNFERVVDHEDVNGTPLLNSNFINCIFADGRHIWVGTESGGLNKLSIKRLTVENYHHDRKNPASLSPNPVNAIFEDRQGTLWVGTVEGGLNRKFPNSNEFEHFTIQTGTLRHNSVSAITADADGYLWVGTWGNGISILDPKHPTRPIRTLQSQLVDLHAINFVGTLAYDPINRGMWVGANQGIYFYDSRKNRFINPLPKGINSNVRGCIGSVLDKDGKLWIGSMDGAYVIDLHSAHQENGELVFDYEHRKYKLDKPETQLIEKITSGVEAHDGTLWLGSNGYGLYKRYVDAEGKQHFKAYTTREGLPNNCVLGVLEDAKGYLWISTSNGLTRFNPAKESFANYGYSDGLDNTQFYWNAACRTSQGILYFGHVTGLIGIDEDEEQLVTNPGQLRFTRLMVNNHEIRPGRDSFLEQDIAVCQRIAIHESEKSLSVDFSALNFEPDNTASYSYRLKGFDKEWIKAPEGRRFASYTNLSPGEYQLQVKYADANAEADASLNNESQEANNQLQMAELTIVIEPYFYKTFWFQGLVFILLVICVWQFYQWRVRNFKRQRELLHQKVEQRTHELQEQNREITRQKEQIAEMAEKVQELTVDKIAFFTNITHEFRTPITLIMGPIERALKLSYNPQVIEQLHFVERNSKYLLSLVNQLMDFRKVESGKLEIAKTMGDFRKFAHELIVPFEAFASKRNISLKCHFHLPPCQLNFDEEAMHKVLTNMLSNAIKFTPDGGTVAVYFATFFRQDEDSLLYIGVSDTGNGIPEDELDKIFDRFYQVNGQTKFPMYGQASSGIGLYLCHRIIELLQGTISVKNNRTRGCSFRILLPLKADEVVLTSIQKSDSQLLQNEEDDNDEGNGLKGTAGQEDRRNKRRLRLLVVEDNADMRSYIHSILRDRFDVEEAGNGVEALDILHTTAIDFIISDLMMPVMDGIELSRQVKRDISISHIPFLMLTAKTSQESRIESYRIGVDEYLLKPFDEELLLARIDNILLNRQRYQRKFALSMDVESLNIEEESSDKLFVNQVMEVIKAHYKDPDFDVANFCEAMSMSKTLLNSKLQSIVGQSTAQFIRNYRLNLARQLLIKASETKNMNIAEIAYEVGFNDPKYFTRCFSKEFNMKPSDVMNGQL